MIATSKEHNLACRLNWLITWEVDNNKYIYNLEAKYKTTCL